MKLKKKQNTWKVLINVKPFNFIANILKYGSVTAGVLFLAYCLGQVSFMLFPNFFDEQSIIYKIAFGMVILLIVFVIFKISQAIFRYVTSIIDTISLAKAVTYLPLNEEDFKKLNFATYRELENYIIHDVFKDGVKHDDVSYGVSYDICRIVNNEIYKTIELFLNLNNEGVLKTNDDFLKEVIRIRNNNNPNKNDMYYFARMRASNLKNVITKEYDGIDTISETFEIAFGKKNKNKA